MFGQGNVLREAVPPVLDESMRTLEERNAFVMASLLQEITRSGTAANAQRLLKRNDVYGKTGTTNDSMEPGIPTDWSVMQSHALPGYSPWSTFSMR